MDIQRRKYLLKRLIAFGSAILMCYLYCIYKIRKEDKKQYFRYMNQTQRMWCVIDWVALMGSIVIMIIGLYVNYRECSMYKQYGTLCQAEIEYRTSGAAGDLSYGNIYCLNVHLGDNQYNVYTWSESSYRVGEEVKVYVMFDKSTEEIDVMLESQKNCRKGQVLISRGLVVFLVSMMIFAYRYNVE